MLTLGQQIRRMREWHPDFRLTNYGWAAAWEGVVRPLAQPYRIRITYNSPSRRIGPMITQAWDMPRVVVLDPRPVARSLTEPVLHVYPSEKLGLNLCLFDPATDEWTVDHYIADTIVPWTIDWLVSYEGWMATGFWAGGGRHPDLAGAAQCTQSDQDDHRSQFANDVLPRLGLPIGNFAFCRLTEAVSEACSPQWSSLNWKADFLDAVPFVIDSILSLAPQPEESLPSDLVPG